MLPRCPWALLIYFLTFNKNLSGHYESRQRTAKIVFVSLIVTCIHTFIIHETFYQEISKQSQCQRQTSILTVPNSHVDMKLLKKQTSE